MNICLVNSSYPPQQPARYCGIGDYTEQLATAAANPDLTINILTDRRYSGAARPRDYLRVYPLVANWRLRELGRIGRFWRQQQFDLIHIQYQPELLGARWSPFNAALVRLARWRDRPVVTTLHTIANPSAYSPTRLTARYLIRTSDHLIITHQAQQEALTKAWRCPAEKMTLIPVGSNVTPTGAQLAQREQIRVQSRRQLDVAAPDLLLAHFGRFYPGKGVETLLQALTQLHGEGLPVRLLLLGHLPKSAEAYQTDLVTLAGDMVSAGLIIQRADLPPAAVSELLLAADVYVVPYSEGLSTRRTSAMAGFAHQLPVISTQGSELPGYFRPNDNLLLVPPDNAESLAAAIRRLHQEPALRQKLATAGQTIAARHSWDTIATQHRDLWRRLVR